jgi:hypothetical protein
MTTEDELIAAAELAVREGGSLNVHHWQLRDESEPDGLVVGINEKGQEVCWMPRADWEQLRKGVQR